MQIRLQELGQMPAHRARFDYTIDLSKEEVGFEFPFLQPVRLEGEVSDEAGAVTLSAVIHAPVSTRCARCGRPVEYEQETDVDLLLVKELENDEEELRDDLFLVESDNVELDDILIPELIMDMPMSVLCREDCKGLCIRCGRDLNDGPCGCVTREIDPRLAVLQKLLDNKE